MANEVIQTGKGSPSSLSPRESVYPWKASTSRSIRRLLAAAEFLVELPVSPHLLSFGQIVLLAQLRIGSTHTSL